MNLEREAPIFLFLNSVNLTTFWNLISTLIDNCTITFLKFWQWIMQRRTSILCGVSDYWRIWRRNQWCGIPSLYLSLNWNTVGVERERVVWIYYIYFDNNIQICHYTICVTLCGSVLFQHFKTNYPSTMFQFNIQNIYHSVRHMLQSWNDEWCWRGMEQWAMLSNNGMVH